MNIVVAYDSSFGNTKKIAEALHESAKDFGYSQLFSVREHSEIRWKEVSVFFIGSPTQGGRPTKLVEEAVDKIPDAQLPHIVVAGFDTRFEEKNQKFALRLLMKTIKYAAEKIARIAEKRGAKKTFTEGFIVVGKEGPLKDGEIERAKKWVGMVISKA